jgi:fructose-1,6-bisphosphatase/inositol monophosphatase family enzyme
VGVEWAGEPRIGVVHHPALGETVHAAKGQGAHWDRSGKVRERARVSDVGQLTDAVLCMTDRALFSRTGTLEQLLALEAQVRFTRGWNDCYAYVLLATGRVDVVVDPVMEVWDIVPLVPIVREAGGTITTWEGTIDAHARRCVATNSCVHKQVCRALNGV